jgi:hypothetical protein
VGSVFFAVELAESFLAFRHIDHLVFIWILNILNINYENNNKLYYYLILKKIYYEEKYTFEINLISKQYQKNNFIEFM